MKKILYLAIAAVITSCTTYEYHTFTKRTESANHVYSESVEVFYNFVDIFNMAQDVDAWSAETDREKQDSVEDRYFYYYKLRTSNDTIKILNMYDVDAALSIATKGKRIGEIGSEWSVMLNDDKFIIKCTADKKWQITTLEENFINIKGDFTIREMPSEDKDIDGIYGITGSGIFKTAPNCGFSHEVEFSITEEVTLIDYHHRHSNISIYRFGVNDEVIRMSSNINLSDGVIELLEIRNDKENYPITAEIERTGIYTIKYRGVTEEWDMLYY